MQSSNYSIVTDNEKREILKRGTTLFPFSIYKRDVREYTAGQISPHWHKELEIFFLEEGCVKLSLIDDEYVLNPGDGFFINAGILHGVSSCVKDVPCRFSSIVFDSVIVSGTPGSVFDVIYVRPFIENGIPFLVFNTEETKSDILKHFMYIIKAFQNKSEGFEFSIRSNLSDIILNLKKHSKECVGKSISQKERNIKKMISYLDENYDRKITISQLANHVHLCVRECQRTFSSTLHMTPKQYLQNRRISVAAELLIQTDIPIIDIGLQCGFESPSYFSKVFKSMIGINPNAYRKKYSEKRNTL